MRSSRLVCWLAGSVAILGIGSVQAAELPVKAPALYSPVPVTNWSGFYVGAHLGGAWGYFRNNAVNTGPVDSDGGIMAGGQIGFNWQNGRAVFGIEGDASVIDIKASTPAVGDFKENWTSTVRGRLGYAIENYLAYVTGGVAFTHVKTALTGGGSASDTIAGATFGFGVEAMLGPNWSARVEALYMGVPEHTFIVIGGPVVGGSHNYAVRAGVNYFIH